MTTLGKHICPSCGSNDMYTTQTSANGGYGPALLPRLGRLFEPAKFDVYLCGNCGHVSFFATDDTLQHLNRQDAGKWRRAW